MAAKEEKKVTEKKEVITAVYKVNLHCQQCANEIRRPLLRTQGIHSVDVFLEKNEVKIKGVIDVIQIHKRIEKLSRKKVELVSPKIEVKKIETEKKVTKEVKEAIVRTIHLKVHMHCDKCEHDLRKRLLRHRGIYSVKTNLKEETLIVEGTIEEVKLVSYIRKKVHKRAEIVTSKSAKEETKGKEKLGKLIAVKEETKGKEKVEGKLIAVKEETKGKEKVEEKVTTSSSQIVEFKEEKKVEAKTTEGNVPYFIHYVYAPQWFSDENPNACSLM